MKIINFDRSWKVFSSHQFTVKVFFDETKAFSGWLNKTSRKLFSNSFFNDESFIPFRSVSEPVCRDTKLKSNQNCWEIFFLLRFGDRTEDQTKLLGFLIFRSTYCDKLPQKLWCVSRNLECFSVASKRRFENTALSATET